MEDLIPSWMRTRSSSVLAMHPPRQQLGDRRGTSYSKQEPQRSLHWAARGHWTAIQLVHMEAAKQLHI